MSKQYDNDVNPFGDGLPDNLSIHEVDAMGFGGVELPASGRVVAKPIGIGEVWANPAQPRRAVPNSLQLYWNGNPDDVADLLAKWHLVASERSGQSIDIYAVLQGQGQGFDLDDAPAVFVEYVALLRLAASIHTDGLINPVTVIQQSDRYLIESGERRWLAYNLLNQYMGADYAKIPAVKSDGANYIWRQATENTQRRSLNAIGMARQLALLIMEARRGVDGQDYDTYEFMVPTGQCDRRFYAQIANGNTHSIPRGMGEKIQGAMDLSKSQLSRYRNLLKLTDDDSVNDALWIRADVEDWAEGAIREVGRKPLNLLKEALSQDDWTLDGLLALDLKVANWQPSADSTLPMGKVETEGTPSPIAQNVPESGAGEVEDVPEPVGARKTMVGLEVVFEDGRNGLVVSEHGTDFIKVNFADGMSAVLDRNRFTVVSSDKASSKTLTDYYDGKTYPDNFVPPLPKDKPAQDEPERPAPKTPISFGQSVSGLLDSDPVLTDYWNGILAAVATIAAVRGKAKVVDRIQRLRSMTHAKAHTMGTDELHELFDKCFTDVSRLLGDVMGEYGGMMDALYDDLVGDDDDDA